MKADKFHKFEYDSVLNAENLDKLEENYTIYEEEIAKLKEHKEHKEEIYKLIAGDNVKDPFWTQDEIIKFIKMLKQFFDTH
jgi:hypothetical protein